MTRSLFSNESGLDQSHNTSQFRRLQFGLVFGVTRHVRCPFDNRVGFIISDFDSVGFSSLNSIYVADFDDLNVALTPFA